MSDRIVSNSERGITTTVNDIEHMESQSVTGLGIIKIYFRPGTNLQRRHCPGHGHQPDHGARYAAGHHAAAGDLLQRFDHADHSTWPQQQDASRAAAVRSRPQLSAHTARDRAGSGHAVSLWRQDPPDPGRSRPAKVAGVRTTPVDIVNAVNAQNLITPSGTAKLGPLEYNSRDEQHAADHRRTQRTAGQDANGTTLFMRDVAHIRDGFAPQTNIVRQDGNRGALMSIFKNGNCLHLQIVKAVKDIVPHRGADRCLRN
jgi:hypothetical protein